MVTTSADNPCQDKPDGEVPEYACRSYTVCQSGQPIIVECPEGEAFDINITQCNE